MISPPQPPIWCSHEWMIATMPECDEVLSSKSASLTNILSHKSHFPLELESRCMGGDAEGGQDIKTDRIPMDLTTSIQSKS